MGPLVCVLIQTIHQLPTGCCTLQELKKKELDELNALLGELGIDTAAQNAQDTSAEGKKKKKKDKKKGEGENGEEQQQQPAAEAAATTAAEEPEGQEDEEAGGVVDPAVVSVKHGLHSMYRLAIGIQMFFSW